MHLLHSKEWSLRYSPGLGNPFGCVVTLCVGEGLRENNATYSALHRFQSLHPLPTIKLGPSGADSLGGGEWACVPSRTLWVSPVNSPVRLGVSPTAATPTGFFQSEVLRLYFIGLEPWVLQSVSLPSCSSWFICTQMWDDPLHQHLLACPSPLATTLLPGCLSLPLLPL